jgi:hypothetical protein
LIPIAAGASEPYPFGSFAPTLQDWATGIGMKRREALQLLCGALATLPLAAHAQLPITPAHRIGILAQDLQPGLLETFRDELHQARLY